jgi:hypothetical protein
VKRNHRKGLIAASFVAACVAARAQAASLVTLNPNLADVFMASADVFTFDGLPGATNAAPGALVPPEAQLSDDLLATGQLIFSSDGGPIAVVDVLGTGDEGDAQSLPNVVCGTSTGAGGSVVFDSLRAIHLDFVDGKGNPALVTRVGAWNDPTGSRIRLTVFNVDGVVLETVEAFQGYFVGINRDGIASARFEHVTNQSGVGFSLDNVAVGFCAGTFDIATDGFVNGADLGMLLLLWGPCPALGCCSADFNQDGVVGGADLGALLLAWTS